MSEKENLWQKLEEKVMLLLTQVETLRADTETGRKEIQRLNLENNHLKQENQTYKAKEEAQYKKLHDLLLMADSELASSEIAHINKPVLIQG